jgi:hypothetical protein
MTSEEAVVGSRVRVSGQYRIVHLRGQVGMITKRWGDPRYVALDMLMDDGASQLFWHHELDWLDGQALSKHPSINPSTYLGSNASPR